MVELLNETSSFDDIKIRRIREGGTLYWIPDPHYYSRPGRYLPAELPIFYNPAMELNRDLTLISIATYSELMDIDIEDITYIEALAGTGIRGFRVLNEVGYANVILNDINPLCTRFMQFNAREFPPSFRAHVAILNYDANHLLASIRLWRKPVDIIDIDPFGTPAPFIDSAIRALKRKNGLLLVTATDTAPLIGKFPNSALRKYGVWTAPTLCGGEIGVRSLIYFVHRIATKYSIAVRPLFGFFLGNFIKIAFLTIPGKRIVDKFWRKIGWININEDINIAEKPFGEGKGWIGPLWIDKMFDKEFVEVAIKKIDILPLNEKHKHKLKKWFSSELKTREILLYYDLEAISSGLKKPTPKTSVVAEILREKGYIAEPTHFNSKAVKTNAPYRDVVNAVIEAQTARR